MLEERVVKVLADWFAEERKRGAKDRTIGIANGALVLLEYFKKRYPLRGEDYTSKGGSQVKGLSGKKGTAIIRRFNPAAPPIGTEAGRTSRGTLLAVRALAERLNAIPEITNLTDQERGQLADVAQRWLVENPFKGYFEQQRLVVTFDPRRSSLANVAAILEVAKERDRAGPVAQHLVGAKLALRYPDRRVDNYSYSTADVQLNRPGDFVVGDTAFHVTMTPSQAVLEKCRDNLNHGYRALLLVPENRREGAAQNAESMGLGDRVAVLSIEAFVGQNVEEIAVFTQAAFETDLRRLLETYNQRVKEVEPDPSLQVEIPGNLGRNT